MPFAVKSRRAAVNIDLSFSAGLRVHGLLTGWVQIKMAHYRYRPPQFLAAARILADGNWAPWLPVYAYAVEHPDMTLMVDTGPDAESMQIDYFDCNSGNRFFFGRNLRFIVDERASAVDQLGKASLAPDQIEKIVITHFHSDHIGLLGAFNNAQLITGPGNWPSHTGAHMCVVPERMVPPRLAAYTDGPIGAFDASEKLTADGRIRLVLLPGHTPGHIGVLVQDQGRFWLMAGDATFNTAQTVAGDIAGVSQTVPQARASQDVIKEQITAYDTVLLPAHDPDALANLVTSAPEPRAPGEKVDSGFSHNRRDH